VRLLYSPFKKFYENANETRIIFSNIFPPTPFPARAGISARHGVLPLEVQPTFRSMKYHLGKTLLYALRSGR